MQKALVINYGSNAVDQLASYLAKDEKLELFVCRYFNQNRYWERKLATFKMLRRVYDSTLGRRQLPTNIRPELVCEYSIILDFLNSLSLRIPASYVRSFVSTNLNLYIKKKLGCKAAKFSRNQALIIGSSGCAYWAFRVSTGRKVLSYPTADYRYSTRKMLREQKRVPAFSETWDSSSYRNRSIVEKEFNLADVILVGSSFAKSTLVENGVESSKVLRVPYGVDTTLFCPPVERESNTTKKFRVLFAGQITQRKGVYYLLEALKKINRSDVELIMVGNYFGSDKAYTGYAGIYKHRSSVPRSVLAQYYRSADVFVFPTLVEGLGLVVLEAMACGLPVITTNRGPGDAVRDGVEGYIIPTCSVDDIAEKIEHLADNPRIRHQMGKNARTRSLVFSWGNYYQAAIDAIFGGKETHPGLSDSPH